MYAGPSSITCAACAARKRRSASGGSQSRRAEPATDQLLMTEPVESSAPAEPVTTEPAPTASGKPAQKRSSFLRELPILIAVALVLALLIKAFLVQAFYIPSESMEDTLHIGDRVLVNKLVYHTRSIHRGEIVVFNGKDTSFENAPEVTSSQPKNAIARFVRSIGSAIGIAPPGEKDFIKRVIGVGGDHVVCCDP